MTKTVALLFGGWTALVAMAVEAAAQNPTPQPVPAALKTAVANAELWGRRLFDDYHHAQPGQYPALIEKAAQTAHAAIKEVCPGRFKLLVPDDTTADGITVYEIAEHREGVVTIGGQTRVLVSPDGATVLSVTRSANSCLVLEQPDTPEGSEIVAAYMTHLLSPAPTEFHVLANLLAKQPMFIGTQAGIWAVDGGTITYLGSMPQQ
jgi:hypothetical protein